MRARILRHTVAALFLGTFSGVLAAAQETISPPDAALHGTADAPASAGEVRSGTDVDLASLLTQLEALDQQVRILSRKLELDQEQAAAAAKTAPAPVAGQGGFALRSADGHFQLRLRGYVHSDARVIGGAGAAPDTFLLRRVRPIVDATIFKLFDVRLMPDFGEGRTVLQDAYIEARFAPWLRVRSGKYKAPLGLERLASATELLFIERGLPTALVPNRDVGVTVLGDVLSERLSYAVGVFNGVADGASADADDRDGKDLVARVFTHPFRAGDSVLKHLGLGLAGSLGTQDGTLAAPNLPQFRTAAQQGFFRYRTDLSPDLAAVAAGRHTRVSPQGYFYRGPFGVLAEFVRSTQHVRAGAAEQAVGTSAWQSQAVWVVTGEDASYRDTSPRRPFDQESGAWGALEIGARVGVLSVDADAFPVFAISAASARRAEAWGLAANWCLNRGVKIMADFDRTTFSGGAPDGADRPAENALLTRVQLQF